jgi:hypothetical protein
VRRTDTTIENPTSSLVPIDVAQDRIEDVTEWKVTPSLAQDAPSIRQALQALTQRYPFFHNQASRIMERLAAFESG